MPRITAMFSSVILAICLAPGINAFDETAQSAKPQLLLATLVGKWQGTCKTWFSPGKLADESLVTGEFKQVLGKRFLKHTYTTTLRNSPRSGEELLVFNPAQNQFQTSWIDDFHMNYGIMFSEGEATPTGFTVTGKYAVGEGHPPWSWKTSYELIDDNHLTITAYNISPQGQEDKAVETRYVRLEI